MGYQYVLVIVFMFLNELKISLTTQSWCPYNGEKNMPLQWQKKKVIKCIPHLGYTFQNLVIKAPIPLSKPYQPWWPVLQTSWNYHWPYHPQLSDREIMGKLDSSRTRLIIQDWMNWQERLQFHDFFFEILLIFKMLCFSDIRNFIYFS